MDTLWKKMIAAALCAVAVSATPAAADDAPLWRRIARAGFSPGNVFGGATPGINPVTDAVSLEQFDCGHHGGHCGGCGHCQAECCCTCWYARAELLFLDRDMSDSVVSFFDSSAAGAFTPGQRALSANDFSFNQEPGARFTLGRQLDLWRSVEFTYLGLHDWKSHAQTAPDPTQDTNLVPLAGFSRFSDAFQQFARYDSELDSFELNYRRYKTPGLSFLAGIRYMSIDEQLAVVSHDAPNPGPNQVGRYKGAVENDMFGAQIGFSWERPLTDRLMFNASGKAGLMINLIDNDSRIINPRTGGGVLLVEGHRDEEALASIFEFNATAAYALSERLSLLAGYNVIIANGVALAVEQVPDGINTGNIVYHGPSVGFEYRR